MRCDGEGAFPSGPTAVVVEERGPRLGDEQQRRADLFEALGALAIALLAHGSARQLRASDLGARLDFAYVWLSRSDGDADLFEKIAAALEADPPLAPASALNWRRRARAAAARSRRGERRRRWRADFPDSKALWKITPAPRRGKAKTEILFESTLHPQLTRGQRGPGGTSPAAAKAQP